MLRLFALYENLTRFVMPLCSAVPGRPNPETPIDQSNNIVDISRVGLKQFWNLRSHMQDASTLATAHYPETLDRIFVSRLPFSHRQLHADQPPEIIGAPSFFPTVWGWIKKWFDPITTSKIFILSHQQVLPTLKSFIDIANIPKKYGGELDFECGKIPVLDQQVRDCLSIAAGSDAEKLFLTAPVRWIKAGDDDEMTALGVGSIDGKQRRETVATLHSLAVRVATSSSRHAQSQGTETVGAPASRPPTHHNQAALPSRPASKGQATPSSRPTSIQPAPDVDLGAASLHDQPVPASGALQHPLQNGGPPEKISMPPPPTEMERTKTDFFTPPSSTSELKSLE